VIRLFLACAASLAATDTIFVHSEQIPPLARAGQPVKLRLRTEVATRIVWEPIEGGPAASREMTRVGEGLWEVDITAPSLKPRDLYQRRVGYMRTFVGATPSFTFNASIAYADGLPPARITRLANDAQRSDYVLNIQSRAFYDRLFPSSGITNFDVAPLSRRIYELFPDEWDFLNIIPATISVPLNRFHIPIRNSVQGIGQIPPADAASFGSASRLQGYSVFPATLIYDAADQGYNHETGHQWVNHMSTGAFGPGRPHWPLSSMSTNLMNYSDAASGYGSRIPCRFNLQADGRITVTPWIPGQEFFNDMDLYLMGLMAPNEVATQYLVTDTSRAAGIASPQGPCAAIGTLTTAQYRTVNASDIVSVQGARVPSSDASQKDFRSLHVVVSRDSLLTPEQMAYFEVYTRRVEDRGPLMLPDSQNGFTNPWYAATKNRSTISAKISAEPVPTISYGGVVNAANFQGAAMGPSAVVTLFGSELAAGPASAGSVPLPRDLNGVRVFVDGIPAPLFYVSPTQINFQLPESLPTTRALPNDLAYIAMVRVERDGAPSNIAYIEIRPTVLGAMSYGDNYAVATNPAGELIGPSNPAFAGSPVVVYFVGSAPLTERVAAGQPAPTDRLIRVQGASLTLGGQVQANNFVGLTPGGVGLYQANMFINGALAEGEYQFVITVNGVTSNPVKIPVRRR